MKIGNTVIMSGKELKDWCDDFKSAESMETYLLGKYTETNDEAQINFRKNIVKTLGELAMKKDNAREFQSLNGVLFRWVYRMEDKVLPNGEFMEFEKLMEKDKIFSERQGPLAGSVEEEEEVPAIPVGKKLYLQLKIQKSWRDWIYVKKSPYKGGGLGAFAATCFPRNSIIGYYCGEQVWQSDVVGGPRPSYTELKEAGVCQTSYLLSYRDMTGRYVVVDPPSVSDVMSGLRESVPLHMGFQFVNDACRAFSPQTTEHEKAKKKQNVVFLEDGSVQATKKIAVGKELLTGYTKDERLVEIESEEEEPEEDAKMPAKENKRKKRKL
jgi:hypothetical protein